MNSLSSIMDNQSCSALAGKIAQVARSTPFELVEAVLPKILAWDSANWALSRAKALVNLHNPQVRADFGALFDLWQRECPDLPGSGVALALQSGLALQEQHEQVQVDLVWTGPETGRIPLRRTDQALLQLIGEAERYLLIVSFAVYKIQPISAALAAAIRRNVRVDIVLEHPDESEGKISFAGTQAFSHEFLQAANVYVWPLQNRPLTEDGRYGSLHAKIALADGKTLLVSSANLTEYAMNLNMEMGVLVDGGELPVQVEEHFWELIERGDLQPIRD